MLQGFSLRQRGEKKEEVSELINILMQVLEKRGTRRQHARKIADSKKKYVSVTPLIGFNKNIDLMSKTKLKKTAQRKYPNLELISLLLSHFIHNKYCQQKMISK